jgi:hypothetical protein
MGRATFYLPRSGLASYSSNGFRTGVGNLFSIQNTDNPPVMIDSSHHRYSINYYYFKNEIDVENDHDSIQQA